MNNLIFQNIRYNNNLFCVTPSMATGEDGFFSLRDFKILEVDTTTRRVKKQFGHGEEIGATYNNAREILLVFDAFAVDEVARFTLIKKINQIFFPSKDIWKKLEFSGPDGSEWRLEAKTIERPSYSDYDNSKWITVTVKLISRNNSNIYSANKNIVSTTNHAIGVIIPMEIPFTYSMDSKHIDYTGPSDSPIDIDIIASVDNACPYGYLLIKNTTELGVSLLSIEVDDFDIGDTIRIDGVTSQVYLKKDEETNRTNITSMTDPNSVYPMLINGDNNISIYNGFDDTMMVAYISYYDILS